MSQPGPGWYPDPWGGGQRWWDGRAWAEHTAQQRPSQPPAPQQQAPQQPTAQGFGHPAQQTYGQPNHPRATFVQPHGPQSYGQRPYAQQPYAQPGFGQQPPRRGGAAGWIVASVALVLMTIFGVTALLLASGGDDGDDRDRDTASSPPTDEEPEGPPTDASEEDFCGATGALEDYIDGDDVDLRSFGENLAEVGTPEDISEDAREGFEIYLELFDDAGGRADSDDVLGIRDDLNSREEDSADEFDDYVNDVCHDSSIYA